MMMAVSICGLMIKIEAGHSDYGVRCISGIFHARMLDARDKVRYGPAAIVWVDSSLPLSNQ